MKTENVNLKELHLWTDGGTQIADAAGMRPYLQWADKKDSILDIGCGDGRVLRFLHQEGYLANGVDLNSELVELCCASGLSVELANATDVVQRDIDKYSVFSMLDFVEHIPMEALLEILEAIAAKPGNRVWIQTPNLDSIMGFKFWFHMPTHVLPLHPWVLRKILDRLGFEILAEWTDWGGLPWKGFRRWLTIKFLTHVFGPPLAEMFLGGGNICLVAKVREKANIATNTRSPAPASPPDETAS